MHRRAAVVVAQQTPLYSGPDKRYQQIGILYEGAEIAVKDLSDNFYKIRDHGRLGWVEATSIAVF